MASNNLRINILFRLNVFCYKAVVCLQVCMLKISKQILKGQVTQIMCILYYFYVFFPLTFLTFKFEFTLFTFWYSTKYLGNKLGSSAIGKIEKTVLTA